VILFLDFDGVLHPNDVYLVDERPVMGNADGHEGRDSLFCFAPLLADALQNRPDVTIVLSTSWVPYLDDDANGWPDDLKHRLIWCEDDSRGILDEQVYARLREALR
jgi:hypothetical protein